MYVYTYINQVAEYLYCSISICTSSIGTITTVVYYNMPTVREYEGRGISIQMYVITHQNSHPHE